MDVLTIQWGFIGGYGGVAPAPVAVVHTGAGRHVPDVHYAPLPPDDEAILIVLLGLLEDEI